MLTNMGRREATSRIKMADTTMMTTKIREMGINTNTRKMGPGGTTGLIITIKIESIGLKMERERTDTRKIGKDGKETRPNTIKTAE